MSGVPTQNNIVEIIKSLNENFSAFDQLLTTVSKIIDEYSAYSQRKLRRDAKKVNNVIEGLFSADGIVCKLIHEVNQLSDTLVSNKLNEKGRVQTAVFDKNSAFMKGVDNTFVGIKNIFDLSKQIKLKVFTLQHLAIKQTFKHIKQVVDNINDTINYIKQLNFNDKTDVKVIIVVNQLVTHINELITNIKTIKLNIVKTKLIIMSLKNLIRVLKYLRRVSSWMSKLGNINYTILARRMRSLRRVIKLMVKIVLLLGVLILVTPIMLAFILISPIIIICFTAIALIVRLITWIVKVLARGTIKGLIVLFAVIGALIIIATELLILTLLAIPIVKYSLVLLGFFGVLIAVFLVVVVVGLLITTVAPVLLLSLVGLGVMVAVISAITLIALELRLIQLLKLDKEKIKTNVNIVLDTAKNIINSLFFEDEKEKGKESGFWGKLWGNIKGIYKGTLMIAGALLAVPLLVATVVSTTLILFIASTLRLLQTLRLDREKIKSNVGIVLGTALDIINTLFGSVEEKEDDKGKSWYRQFIEWGGKMFSKVLSGVTMIIEAVLAIGFLSLTVISTAMLLFIGLLLKGIQNIELDRDKITENVDNILDTVRYIIDRVLAPQNKKPDNKPKSWVKGFISNVFKGFAPVINIIEAITAIGFLTVVMVSVGILRTIVNHLKTIQETEINKELIFTRIDNLFDTIGHLVNKLFESGKKLQDDIDKSMVSPSKGSIIDRYRRFRKKNKTGLSDEALDLMERVPVLKAVGSIIGVLGGMVEGLNSIQEFEVKPDVDKRVESLLNTATAITKRLQVERDHEGIKKKYVEHAERMQVVFNSLSTTAETLKALGELDDAKLLQAVTSTDKINKVLQSVQNVSIEDALIDKADTLKSIFSKLDPVIKTLGGDSSQLDSKKVDVNMSMLSESIDKISDSAMKADVVKIDNFSKVTDILQKYVSISNSLNTINNDKLVDNSIKFIDKVNSSDLSKLEVTTRMFGKMAEFSQSISGNFEGLAQALNDKIMPLLEELKEQIEGVRKETEAATQAVNRARETATDIEMAKAGLADNKIQEELNNNPESRNSKLFKRAKQRDNIKEAILSVLTGEDGAGVLVRNR